MLNYLRLKSPGIPILDPDGKEEITLKMPGSGSGENHWVSMIRFIKMVWEGSRGIVLLQGTLVLIAGLLPTIVAYCWQLILERMEIEEKGLYVFFISLALSGGLMASIGYFREIFDTIFRNSVSRNMQKRIHRKASRLPMDDFETPSLNDIIDRAGGTFFYGDAVGSLLTTFYMAQMAFSIIMTGIMVWNYHPFLVLPLLAILVVRGVCLGLDKKRIDLEVELAPYRRHRKTYQKYLTKYEHAKEIRLTGSYERFMKKWSNVMTNSSQKEEKVTCRLMKYQILLDSCEQLSIITAYTLCIYLASNGCVGISEFGALVVLLQQFLKNAQLFMARVQTVYSESIRITESLRYFSLEEEDRPDQLASPVHTISLNHACYRYPEMQTDAVADISLELHMNEIIAVVGENGSGKTTLSKLISGLTEPTSGEVLFDGVPANRIGFSSLYRDTTAVFQDFTKYYMTVRENIKLGDTKRQMSDEDLNMYLKELGITFLSDKKIPFDTQLGIDFGGLELSGGQWQQLAIARGSLKGARAIFLDEPTSALDPLKETQLYNTFQKLCHGKIGVIITHRMSLCTLADRILVMKNGHIAECGTHSELMETRGDYYHLYSKQAEMYQA